MSNVPSVKLNNDVSMPSLGFGTWQIPDGKEVIEAVSSALEAGYRLIDTARIYRNESGVGKAIASSGIPREEIFVTTKLWNDDQGYDSALKAFDASLERLGLDYIDLYLIHWPATDMRGESWRALQHLYKSGRAKSIGVSNYTVRHLQELLDNSEVVPAVNQVEYHPFLYQDQRELLAFCGQKGIAVEAYSPLAHARDTHHPILMEVADRYHKSPAQVMLRWAIAQGTVPIPKSSHAGRMAENIDIFDFELDENDIKHINQLSSGSRSNWDPTEMP